MPSAIEDYAIISDCYTAALIGRDGSIDWLCMPHYDSEAMFAALLGSKEHGRWLLAPQDSAATAERRYDGNTFVLITTWTTSSGVVEVTEFMPTQDSRADIVRRVRGIRGTVTLQQDLRVRFSYASVIPWVRKIDDDGSADRPLVAVGGPDAIIVRGPELHAADHNHRTEFTVSAGETVDLTMTWYPSHRQPPAAIDVDAALAHTTKQWEEWAGKLQHTGPYHDSVMRSLLVLRALTHEETGGIVAAPTTSLPEDFGGSRNWDYRYVWLRDASLTLSSLLVHGYVDEVRRWRNWLLRAIAGDPADVQIMYGIRGQRNLPERELSSLPGYRGSSPVRVGNGAAEQYQADVLGEVMVALHEGREAGVQETSFSWALQRHLLAFLAETWQRPDHGLWEIRGEPHAFTHSRVMVWAAFDRGIRAIEEFGLTGPLEEWKAIRRQIFDEVNASGFNESRGCFTQHYSTTEVDASLLQLPQVGFCAPDDPRMLATVEAIEQDLMRNGFLLRYRTQTGVDGLPGDEHPFLACSFWLVEQYAVSGRLDDARDLMDRLVAITNDVGLLSEEYDVDGDRQAGNMPQAFSHLTLVRAADAINNPDRTTTKNETGQPLP